MGCVTVVDEDGAWARERARAAVAPYVDVVARLDPTVDASAPLPLDRFCIAGTPEEVAARVEELWDAGADRVELGTPQGRTTPAGVDADLRPSPPAAPRADPPGAAGERRPGRRARGTIAP